MKSAEVTRLFSSTARDRVHLGVTDETGDDRLVFSRVVDARVTESGRHIVVLDQVPPFVRVFDASGRLRSAFLGRGGGPREARGPRQIAVAGDSLVLVLSGRVSVFDLDGNLVQETRELAFSALAVADGCEGDWLFYGPVHGPGTQRVGARENGWLHRVELRDTTIAHEVVYADAVIPRILAFGKRYPFSSGGDRAVLYHEHGDPPQVLEWTCPDKRIRPVAFPLAEASELERRQGRIGEHRSEVLTLSDTLTTGMGVIDGGVVWFEKVGITREPESRTEVKVVFGDSLWHVRVPDPYRLHDSKAGVGLLVGRTEPVPYVFLIDALEFVEAVMTTPGRKCCGDNVR